jgi:hypothetical protein
MIARCVTNRGDGLPSDQLRKAFAKNVHQDEVDLAVGREYRVYGIIFREGLPWYLVSIHEEDEYPVPHLAALFTICDPTVPNGWALTVDTGIGDLAILPARWAAEPRYMEKLVDGVTDEIPLCQHLVRQSSMEIYIPMGT